MLSVYLTAVVPNSMRHSENQVLNLYQIATVNVTTRSSSSAGAGTDFVTKVNTAWHSIVRSSISMTGIVLGPNDGVIRRQ